MNQGILTVATYYDETHVRLILPPEHRIAAVKPLDPIGYRLYLIEGPHMPGKSTEGNPQHVTLIVANDMFGPGFATWEHDKTKSWPISLDWRELMIRRMVAYLESEGVALAALAHV